MLVCLLPRSVKKIAGHVCPVEGFFLSLRKTPGICECTRTEFSLQGNFQRKSALLFPEEDG